MSYNIDHSEYIDGVLYIRPSAVRQIREAVEADVFYLAEGNFLESLPEAAPNDDPIPIKHLWWYGGFSGNTYKDVLVEKVLPLTTGEATIVFVWEGGDSIGALHVKDGFVTEKNVKYTVEV